MSPQLTALRCLFVMAQHNGIQISPERLLKIQETNVIGSLLRLMHDVGLAGRLIKNLKWGKLAGLGSSFPMMAEMKGGFWVILVGVFNRGSSRRLLQI